MDLLSYVNVIADVLKSLIGEWNLVEDVAVRFIEFMEQVTLTILHK